MEIIDAVKGGVHDTTVQGQARSSSAMTRSKKESQQINLNRNSTPAFDKRASEGEFAKNHRQ